MKKAIIGISGVIILSLVVILFVNAKSSTPDSKKATTTVTVSDNCAKCPSAATCTMATTGKTGTCDQSSATAAKCDSTKCDKTNCDKANCDKTTCDKTNCKEACETKSMEKSTCPGTCPMKSALK
ncbi:MAG: hypothetical protein U0X39_09515 [Bacteroidales bacterium]